MPSGTARARDISVRSQLVGTALEVVSERGGDGAALAARFGLPPDIINAAEVILPLRDLHRFFDAAEREAGVPSLGLHMVKSVPARRFSAIEYGAKTAPTVRAALSHVARAIPLFNEHVVVTFEERAEEGLIRQSIPGRPLCVGRVANEFFSARVFAGLREAAPGLTLRRVFFAHPRPEAGLKELKAFFCVEARALEFGAEANGLVFARQELDRELATRDDALAELVRLYVESELARRRAEPGGGLVSQVRELVRGEIENGGPGIANVAERLRMSPRSLQRRLHQHGTSLHAVLQLVREELARTWVVEGRRPLLEIAFALGYAELAPFVRAFKRWTNQTPAAYRSQELTARKRT